MLELRILSGYHRGATLPLGDEALVIGADEDADVVLADPGVAARHAQLSRSDAGWVLTPEQGEVRDQHTNAVAAQVTLDGAGFARVGAVWVALREAGSPWQDPPPEPKDDPLAVDTQDQEPDQQADTDAEGTTQAPADGDQAGQADPEPVYAQNTTPTAAAPRRKRGLRVVMVPVAAVAILSAAAAYALTAPPQHRTDEIAAREADQVRRLAGLPQQLGQDELQAALRKRLAQIDLLGRVNLELDARQWTIRGALNDDDGERLQRMLRSFAQSYVIDFPVNVKIGSAESMLPFRISQVISGNDPSIVTDDGRRLYVGDEYRGVRLAAVAGNQLKFTGKHNLNIVW